MVIPLATGRCEGRAVVTRLAVVIPLAGRSAQGEAAGRRSRHRSLLRRRPAAIFIRLEERAWVVQEAVEAAQVAEGIAVQVAEEAGVPAVAA